MIELQGLTKFYGTTCAVSDLSCSIPKGEIVGILGLNGAGKSTLLRMLAGDLLPTAGTIRIGEVDAVAEPQRIRARIGFLPEEPPLYDEMTVRGYLRYLARLRGLDARRASARLEEVMARTGIEDYADEPIGTLSTGYRKRLGIAQAIVHEPLLVILDEPISGLDPVQIAQMREMIRSLRGEHTVLVSSHILPEIHETCDEILVLRNGELVFQ
ncbi:MAG: ABC transporter ATP-binding protein, partial [Deltaproteobacteria bacterium]